LGRLTEAIEPMRATLQINADTSEWENAAVVANNLSELELTLGELRGEPGSAVRDAEQSVAFADRSGEWGQRIINRTTLADACTRRAAGPRRRRGSARPRTCRPSSSPIPAALLGAGLPLLRPAPGRRRARGVGCDGDSRKGAKAQRRPLRLCAFA